MELLFIYLLRFFSYQPYWNGSYFVGLTQDDDKRTFPNFAVRCKCFVIMIISFFRGYVLSFFGISMEALRIAGGIVIATSGFSLLSGEFSKTESKQKSRK
jgi:multiple antibiotic resistance protein